MISTIALLSYSLNESFKMFRNRLSQSETPRSSSPTCFAYLTHDDDDDFSYCDSYILRTNADYSTFMTGMHVSCLVCTLYTSLFLFILIF